MYELKDKEMIFIYTGPDGSGRKTLGKMVSTVFNMKSVTSYTTRAPRNFETNGEDYHFISEKTFMEMKKNNEFIEEVEIDGIHYGLREQDIKEAFDKHKIVYLALNPEGASLLKDIYGDKVIRIFVYADRETVQERQKERGDNDEEIQRHMTHYDETMDYKDDCEHAFENYDLPQVSFQISELIETYLDRDYTIDEY